MNKVWHIHFYTIQPFILHARIRWDERGRRNVIIMMTAGGERANNVTGRESKGSWTVDVRNEGWDNGKPVGDDDKGKDEGRMGWGGKLKRIWRRRESHGEGGHKKEEEEGECMEGGVSDQSSIVWSSSSLILPISLISSSPSSSSSPAAASAASFVAKRCTYSIKWFQSN